MSTQSESLEPQEYEEGFFSQNTWIRPVIIFDIVCFVIISLIILANDFMGWLGGRFGQVVFGMVASLIFLSFVISAILLIVNGARYWSDKL
jgi:hypothetical protein